jgi:digeranylgeranylglycerophospholipid reductase
VNEHDVVIVGGGPGGLQAGLRLAERGLDVVILEEHEAIGVPVHCTGVLASDAFEEFGASREAVINDLVSVSFHSPSGRSVAYTPAQVEAVVIDRHVFDLGIARRAQAAGVELLRGWRVTDIAVDASRVTVTARGERQFTAKACVLACGASYAFHRRLGLGFPAVFLQSAQAELPCERLCDVEVHFGRDIAPSGFAWAVPVQRPSGPHVRIGVMTQSDAAVRFERVLARVAPRWRVRVPHILRPRQKILPLAPIGRTFMDRVVAVGDAAGLVKPTTGGGIYYSLVSADIAADVLGRALERGDLSARALSEYERRWRKRLSLELRAQLALRRAAERLTDADIDGLLDLATSDGIMPIVRRTARFNHHRDLIVALFKHPPARRILFRALAG